MTEKRRGLDYGLIGAMSDIGLSVVLGIFLAVNTDWSGDAAPRPLVVGILYATPGLIALLGVLAERPWLLIAGSLPLFPAAGLSDSGATLVFLLPAALMTLGAMRMINLPNIPRMTAANVASAIGITLLVLLAGWSVLIGLTEPACHTVAGGQACGSGYISINGLVVAAGCLLAAVAIAIVGAGGLSKVRR